VAHAPHRVVLRFDEAVVIDRLAAMHVTTESGDRVESGDLFNPHGNEALVAVRLHRGLGDGTYTVAYRLLSDDGHPVTGTIRFVVGHGALKPASGESSGPDPVVKDALVLSRWLSYAGLALLAGVWLLLTVWPAGRDVPRAQRMVQLGWFGAVVGATFELLLQGPYIAGGDLGDTFNATLLHATIDTRYGELRLTRLALLAVLALVVGSVFRGWAPRWLVLPVSMLGATVAWTFADGGHAATTSPVWFSVAAQSLHVLAVISWLGGLAMLVGAVFPRRDADELRRVLNVYSNVALTSVALIVATGAYAAWRGTGSVDAIFTTTYGLLIIGKIALLAGIVAVAYPARNLLRRLDGSDEVVVERLRRSVWVETVVAFVVLVLAAVLVGEPRGRDEEVTSSGTPVQASQVGVPQSNSIRL
jgi:copper transport protein